jgi:predicted dehydrogenase
MLRQAKKVLLAAVLALGAMQVCAAGDKPLQLALVGCAHIHTPSYAALLKAREDVKVKSVWDHDAARAKKRAEDLGAAVVEDVAKIWADPEIQAVVICSETNRHEELVIGAAKAKKHLFVEKPLGLGARDSYAMMQAVEAAGVVFELGYPLRGEGRVQFVRDQIAKGNFGKITRIRGSNCHDGAVGGWFDTEWRWTTDFKQSGVGGYGDIGTHSLDLMILLMGDVSKVAATLTPGTARYPGCDEGGEALLCFANGVIGTLAGSWADASNPVSLEICGTEGHAVFLHDQVLFQSKKVEGASGRRPYAPLPKPLPNVMELFLDAVQGKPGVPLVTVREAAYRCAVMEALYQSAKDGKWVAPQPPPAKP